ncbi:MAG: zinc ribbon domain-containing protein [Gammaproteobacteria bacterium]|nr:zinc ribbon domain-containing protein [Gammaproteobacteria bacterium]
MPIYEYECHKCGDVFEKIQKFSDAELTECECGKGGEVKKLISAAAFHLKGGGWYVTDFRDKSKTGADAKGTDSTASSTSGASSDSSSSSSKEAASSTKSTESSSSKSSDTASASSTSTSTSTSKSSD